MDLIGCSARDDKIPVLPVEMACLINESAAPPQSHSRHEWLGRTATCHDGGIRPSSVALSVPRVERKRCNGIEIRLYSESVGRIRIPTTPRTEAESAVTPTMERVPTSNEAFFTKAPDDTLPKAALFRRRHSLFVGRSLWSSRSPSDKSVY